MNKVILVIVSLVLLLALGFFYMKPIEQKITNEPSKKKAEHFLKKIQKKEQPMPKVSPNQASKPTKNKENITTDKQEEGHIKTALYETLSIEEAKLITPPRKNIAPIAAIRITQNMSELQSNDTLTLSDIEGEDYTLTIQSITQNNDGSTSTTASYEDEGISYTTTITQSAKSNYITLSTANGLYEIETRADTGYIYRTDSIRKALQSRTPNDVIILPIPKNTSSE